MEIDSENITTVHEADLDDLIQYEEVEYEYEDAGDDEYQMDPNASMEEEHLEYEEEPVPEPVAITKIVHVPQQQQSGRQTIVRNSQGQIMIVQSAPTPTTSVPIKIISQPVVSGGIQIVRKGGSTIMSSPPQQQQQQRVVTQFISPQSPNNSKFVLKQEPGQQIILASTSKEEPSTSLTRQFISGNRGNVTITRTPTNQSPTILNTKVVQRPAPPSITVKQIRSPPLATNQTRTLLNKSASPNAQRVLLNQQRVVKVPNSSPGTLQAVNIPGKGLQYVRVLNSQAPSNVTITPKKIINSTLSPTNSSSRVLVPGKTSGTYTLVPAGGSQQQIRTIHRPAPTVVKRFTTNSPQKLIAVVKKEKDTDARPMHKPGEKVTRTTVLTTSQLNQLKGVNIIPGSNSKTKIVMLPSDYMEQLRELQARQPDKKLMPRTIVTTSNAMRKAIKRERVDDFENGKKRRCNCTKSQCLKLYCDCFAAGEFCGDCNCKDCFNDLNHVDDRLKAVQQCLERNPFAFKPKIKDTETLRLHHKGCNCKRSGCLKNYCECYEAKVTCSGICKCIGCHNFDPAMAEEKEAAERELQREKAAMKRAAQENTEKPGPPTSKHPFNFMTPDVIEATVQCMVAQAEECQKREMDVQTSERMILEEFGRCLVEIIDFSTKNE